MIRRTTRRAPVGVVYNRALRRRSALAMTETELKLMAAAASIRLSNNPVMG